MKKLLTLMVVLFVLPCAFSQEKSTQEKEVDEIIDNLLLEDQNLDSFIDSLPDFQFLYVSINYNIDTYFSGRDIGIDQYNLRPQITYMHSKGFFASLSVAYYSEFVPNWDYTTATLGYGKSLDKHKSIRWYSSYSRYFYSDGVENPFGNAISFGIGIKNKKKTLGTQLTATYLFGDDSSFQIDSRSFITFNLLKTKKVRFLLKPQLGIVAGEQTLELAQTSFQNGVLITDYLENDVFDLINTQINLPLQFSSNSFDIELGYIINFPSALVNESNLPVTGYFNFSLGYMLDL
ncbi:MAG: hypothetical protein WBM53_15665 [Maribacter sp.]